VCPFVCFKVVPNHSSRQQYDTLFALGVTMYVHIFFVHLFLFLVRRKFPVRNDRGWGKHCNRSDFLGSGRTEWERRRIFWEQGVSLTQNDELVLSDAAPVCIITNNYRAAPNTRQDVATRDRAYTVHLRAWNLRPITNYFRIRYNTNTPCRQRLARRRTNTEKLKHHGGYNMNRKSRLKK